MDYIRHKTDLEISECVRIYRHIKQTVYDIMMIWVATFIDLIECKINCGGLPGVLCMVVMYKHVMYKHVQMFVHVWVCMGED